MAVVALALVALPAAVAAGKPAMVAPGFLPTVAGERVLLIGVDGVLPGEFDYLLKRGSLPTFARLGREGATLRYERDPEEPPAAFWTTIATGLPSPLHGVASVDSFRPLGMETALAVNGPFRWYWAEVARPLGLARQRPLLSNRRSAFTFWELVGRGGDKVAAVNWWGTYPAGRLPGLVVAHGGYQLIAEGAAGAVAPESQVAGVVDLRRRVESSDDAALRVARAALPADAAAALAGRALLPESFYRQAFKPEALFQPHASALYLPAVDLAADGWAGGEVAFADLLAAELGETDRMLGEVLAMGEGSRAWGTVVVVFDPGRRGGGEGRALLWRRDACGARSAITTAGRSDAANVDESTAAGSGEAVAMASRAVETVRPEELASGLFRAAGLPQSGELPAPPGVCRWPNPPASTPTYGRRETPGAAASASDEYLRNLRSLGYV
ncbi:MAG TPA: alkaline phosphatase family protein [Thermoanaerobaculia bacterium]|nr:alkaline phosphatase family protein [Thermoanaerobaculia bacterium]